MKIKKRIFAFAVACAMTLPNIVQLTAAADEGEKYQYTMFGRNGITMNAGNLCMNGSMHTNKEAVITASNKNINGTVTTGSDIEKRVKHVYDDQKIHDTYFTENCDLYEEEYVYSDINIHINNPLYCQDNISLDGNVSLNSSMGSLMDIHVTGEVKNANNSIVYSKYGNITIENDSTANINGLVYAPLGTLTINSPNINLNGVIIADQIVINGSSVNINGNDNIARFIGTTSEIYDFSGLEYLPEEWLGDSDADDLFDIYEKVIDSDPFNPHTDADELPDGYEVLTLNTDPLEVDTDENGVWDCDEDFDCDNLSNLGEYQNQTDPFTSDTDEDGLLDGDEIYTYGTIPTNPDTDGDSLLDGEEGYDGTLYADYGIYFDPLNPDTDGDGIWDGDEVFGQTKEQVVETHDEAITEVTVDMDTNGSLERNLSIESMYEIDAMTTDVYALVGEPFNFESATGFESATITFKIDQSKLGDTLFDNLIILWYNEEEQKFEEMPTTRDAANSTVSTTTTHFSQYMVVDSVKWYENWDNSLRQLRKMWSAGYYSQTNLHTIILLDCSVSMTSDDPYSFVKKIGYNGITAENYDNPENSINTESDISSFCVKSCDRFKICDNIFNNMGSSDAAAVITFSNQIEYSTGLTYDIDVLKEAMDYINGDGGTAYLNSALNYARSLIDGNSSDLYRIVVITNDDVTFDVISSDDFSSNTTLNIVNLGSNAIGYGIEGVAQATGGDVYNAVSAGELTCQSGGYIYTPPQYIGTDSDGDSIPDLVELYGLLPNGELLETSPYETDSDFDGIPDNEEFNYIGSYLTSNVTLSEYLKATHYKSKPFLADTDGDGLLDGKRVFYNGKVLLPIDPNPNNYDGPKGVWNAQKEMVKSGNIPVSYTNNACGANELMNEISLYADSLVDTLLNAKVIANEYVIDSFEFLFKDMAENDLATVSGADFLDFIYDDRNMAYHSQIVTWQKAFGYNDIYDKVFEYGSNMDKDKLLFSCNGSDYALWLWKGDYWNLQSGAEMGLYVYNRTVNDVKHYNVVDFNLPMTLSLYNSYNGYVENVFSWAPNENQWWITGFNPEYSDPNPNVMVTIGSIDFTGHEDMYESLKSRFALLKSMDRSLIFDDEYNTVWIVWE